MLHFDNAVDAIHQQGYFIQENFWPSDEALEIQTACHALLEQGSFQPARIGRGQEKQLKTSIRSDLIYWLEGDLPQALQKYLSDLEHYRQQINQHLLLGLDHVEVHAACYPPGAHYDKHLDRHRDDDARTLTVILYLNQAWQENDGGQLVIDLPCGEVIRVQPKIGTFVSFLSAEFPHAVLATERERMTLTGWFRRNTGFF